MKLNTKIEIGKKFYTIMFDEGIRIIPHTCTEISVTNNYAVVYDEINTAFSLKDCYRYLSDLRNAFEKAINELEVKK